MVKITDATPEQTLLIKMLHEKMGIQYIFPNIEGHLFFLKKLICNDDEPMAATALKLTAEAFMWIDPDLSTYEKTSAMMRLAQLCKERVKGLELQDVTAWIPPDIEPNFGNALAKMGWSRSPWASWSVSI